MPRRLTAEEYAALPEILVAAEVALILGASEVQVRRWVAAGEIPAVQIGRMVRFSKTRIEAMVTGEVPPAP
jgi:excisionase family DNA binding protein